MVVFHIELLVYAAVSQLEHEWEPFLLGGCWWLPPSARRAAIVHARTCVRCFFPILFLVLEVCGCWGVPTVAAVFACFFNHIGMMIWNEYPLVN